MPKTIVPIDHDAAVTLIHEFRVVNLDAGKAKKNNDITKFNTLCNRLVRLADTANEMGFNIWVNKNGHTGHTYSKDYKETPDTDNDYDGFMKYATAAFRQSLSMRLISRDVQHANLN